MNVIRYNQVKQMTLNHQGDNPLFHPYAINIKDKSMIERWMLRMTNRFSCFITNVLVS